MNTKKLLAAAAVAAVALPGVALADLNENIFDYGYRTQAGAKVVVETQTAEHTLNTVDGRLLPFSGTGVDRN